MQHSRRDPNPEVVENTAEVHKIAGCRILAGIAHMATALDLEIGRCPGPEVLEEVVGSLHILAGVVHKIDGELFGPGWQSEAAEDVDDTVPGQSTSHKTGFLGNLEDLNVAGMAGSID